MKVENFCKESNENRKFCNFPYWNFSWIYQKFTRKMNGNMERLRNFQKLGVTFFRSQFTLGWKYHSWFIANLQTIKMELRNLAEKFCAFGLKINSDCWEKFWIFICPSRWKIIFCYFVSFSGNFIILYSPGKLHHFASPIFRFRHFPLEPL